MVEVKTIITSVVAHIDHGKTTLIDSLIAQQGKISKSLAGDIRYMDTREDEQSRGITLKLSAITLVNKDTKYIIIDTPGHVDFEFLVETSSILSDCFLVLIDVLEGITPRTYALINYVKKKSSILVINKIDKLLDEEEASHKINNIIRSINAMLGDEVFDWKKNNIVLCCAILCFGINYNLYAKMLKNKGCSITNAIKFVFYLQKIIDEGKSERICEKYKIKVKNKKNILSTVLPLGDVLFDSIHSSYEYIDWRSYLCDPSNIVSIEDELDREDTVCFSSLAILRKPNLYHKSNLTFITRLFNGRVSKNDILYMRGEEVVIESIFLFGINEFIETDTVEGSNLICLTAKLRKNSLLSSKKHINYNYKEKLSPFYRTKLILDEAGNVNEFKDFLRVIINTEQCLKIIVNKYNEIEMTSSGKVQVEKLLEDIKKCNFIIKSAKMEAKLCEYPRGIYSKIIENESFYLKIEIYKNRPDKLTGHTDEFKNIFVIKSDDFYDTVLSVLEIYVLNGPLIRENIRSTTFIVEFRPLKEIEEEFGLFNMLKHHINQTYLNSSPAIASFFNKLNISLQKQYLGQVFYCLQKYKYILCYEDYDETIDFYVLSVLVPQMSYDSCIEDIRIKTKGTAYIVSNEDDFNFEIDFSEHVDSIRKEKGLLTNEKIVNDPEKQRTLKK